MKANANTKISLILLTAFLQWPGSHWPWLGVDFRTDPAQGDTVVATWKIKAGSSSIVTVMGFFPSEQTLAKMWAIRVWDSSKNIFFFKAHWQQSLHFIARSLLKLLGKVWFILQMRKQVNQGSVVFLRSPIKSITYFLTFPPVFFFSS